MKSIIGSILVLILLLPPMSANSADRVVVIPLGKSSAAGSPDRLWGEGRPNTTTLLHDIGPFVKGACTADSGVKFSLSKHLASWGNAASVCPKDTWVCSRSHIGDASCPITINPGIPWVPCDGTITFPVIINDPYGWLADLDTNTTYSGILRSSGPNITFLAQQGCREYRVWCCRE